MSRCQPVRFAPLPPQAVEERLASASVEAPEAERRAAARLCGGDSERALFLLTDPGRELRSSAEACARAARSNRLGDAPWLAMLETAERAGNEAATETTARVAEREAMLRGERGRRSREPEEAGRRAGRRRRVEVLDLRARPSAGAGSAIDGSTASATAAASAIGSAPATRVVFLVAKVGKPRSSVSSGAATSRTTTRGAGPEPAAGAPASSSRALVSR